MKNRIQPIAREKLMRENDFIVSKTDTRGRITYGNRIFIEFSGYSEQELLGAQHNIIRHPDMPRGVFKFLWDTIAGGNEVFAYVKNMAKDGSFYWVFANVTPDYDASGNIIGYLSVRRYPKRSAVDTCEGLYQLMLTEEQRAGPRDACEASLALLGSVLKQHGKSYEELVFSL
ncbi:PAS domain-containing protein [Chitinilyticum piscinae]|uniref:PAS domain-containing protein n=1 Tax=Chitinilyticum piscinae TaxID=2866724 RepID=A0A8J7FLK5_9NEIS|nr:PAS domain-containing protein [Chitinilyticum piscinae]MBE9608519.1 PAS domain-containing protein [Chitinilyticum piscinae]